MILNRFILLFIFLLFLIKSFHYLDPDFGWHLRMGELILSHGFPKTDPFSYSMPSFPFVDHEWGANVFISVLYRYIGWIGLSVVFATFTLLALLIPLKAKFNKYFALPVILGGGSLFFFTGVRPQVITWLLFSILVTFLFEKKFYERSRFLLPLFFLVWANMHGGFAIGIAVFLVFLLIKTYKNKKLDLVDLSIFLISLLFTLINPYGIRLWGEIWQQMSDSSLRSTVEEWKPLVFSYYPPLWSLIAISGFFLLRFIKQLGAFKKITYLSALVAGFLSIRHMPLWTIVSLPVLLECLGKFEEQIKKIKFAENRLKKAYVFCLFLGIILVLLPIFSNPFLVNESNYYPKKAVGYLKNHESSGQLFSAYGWGGYLIWKLPEKKVFIDGRMPSWRWSANIKNESNYAFAEHRKISDGSLPFNKEAEKYGIDTVLLPIEGINKRTLKSILDSKTNDRKFFSKLRKDGWKVIYKDKVSVIYRRDSLWKKSTSPSVTYKAFRAVGSDSAFRAYQIFDTK